MPFIANSPWVNCSPTGLTSNFPYSIRDSGEKATFVATETFVANVLRGKVLVFFCDFRHFVKINFVTLQRTIRSIVYDLYPQIADILLP